MLFSLSTKSNNNTLLPVNLERLLSIDPKSICSLTSSVKDWSAISECRILSNMPNSLIIHELREDNAVAPNNVTYLLIWKDLVLYKIHDFNKTTVTEFILLAFGDLQNLQILLFVFALLAFIACIVGNSVILVLVKCECLLHTPMYFLISNFAFMEIIFVSVTVPKLLANLLVASQRISFTGCFAQMYTFDSLAVTECYLLAVMAFDRDLAINKPLHYSRIMNNAFCIELAIAPWIIGFAITAIPTILTAELKFCGPNEINHFFCDLAPLQNLACSNPMVSNLVTSSGSLFGSILPFLIILGFYIHIIALISKIKSTKGKQKAFSTCSSHLTVASLFYSSGIIIYIKPKGSQHDKFLALIYTVITPFLNPFIYTLRNRDVKTALKNTKLVKVLGEMNISHIYLGQIRISHIHTDHCRHS
ncbi:olfactory receptor 6N1-like [Phyllobates terribilis]|uniref:olfactory receptor 6N1-like n=1 Tax=Phyllobates terribilis TaxID=111132 RepID=UPI003CCAE3BA